MKTGLLLLFFLFMVGPSGCSALQANQEISHQGTLVPVTQLGPKRSGPRWSFTDMSGIWEARRMVISDREAWLDVWKRIHSPDPTHGPYSNLPPLPEIDFAREMLIVVALGSRPTGSYGIIVDGAYEREKQLEIVVRSMSPGKGCFTTQAFTQPVDIVRLVKTKLPVVFRETEIVNECK